MFSLKITEIVLFRKIEFIRSEKIQKTYLYAFEIFCRSYISLIHIVQNFALNDVSLTLWMFKTVVDLRFVAKIHWNINILYSNIIIK